MSSRLLDTDCLIGLARATPPELTDRYLAAVSASAELWVSTITLVEFRYGIERSARHAAQEAALSSLLSTIQVAPFDEADAASAARLKALLASVGRPIGAYDLLIAGQALARNWILVTANTREFSRVPGLVVEDWTIPA